MRRLKTVTKLARLDSSLLVFFSLFVPLLARTRNVTQSLGRAAPLLFIGICTFIANDLDDIEKDQVNHPDRPLPSEEITPTIAVVLYFASLTAALFAVRHYISTNAAFLYYAVLVLTISYGYVVDFLPGFKSVYVAAVSSLPVLIVATYYSNDPRLGFVAGSVFFIVLGRELCMDFLDRDGDAASFLHGIEMRSISIAAFSAQAIGILLLATQIHRALDVVVLALITIVFGLSAFLWSSAKIRRRAIFLMKIGLFLGLYFLT